MQVRVCVYIYILIYPPPYTEGGILHTLLCIWVFLLNKYILAIFSCAI